MNAMVQRVSNDFADQIPDRVGSLLYTAIDSGDGTAITVTFFADENAARHSSAAVGEVQKSLGVDFGVIETEVIQGKILVHRANDKVVARVDPESAGHSE